ncbi:MAG: AtpZ/AtpI family protein [Hymenobacter sp.]|nr:MAG: AtpZ/AtpI family protein [Hymenobacter sp.]
MNNYIKYSGMGFQMIVILGIFSFAGYKIDQYLQHQVQWVTAIMALTGIFVSLYIVFKSLKS